MPSSSKSLLTQGHKDDLASKVPARLRPQNIQDSESEETLAPGVPTTPSVETTIKENKKTTARKPTRKTASTSAKNTTTTKTKTQGTGKKISEAENTSGTTSGKATKATSRASVVKKTSSKKTTTKSIKSE